MSFFPTQSPFSSLHPTPPHPQSRNHGACLSGACVCDDGYSLVDGTCLPDAAPSVLREAFNDDVPWPSMEGGAIASSSACSAIDAGSSLFFGGPSGVMRKALTPELDGRTMTYLSFVLSSTSACDGFTSFSQSVGVFFSIDGARSFTRLSTIISRSNTETYVLTLPAAARVRGLQILFWQPSFTSSRDDWALDTVYVGNDAPSGQLLTEVSLNFSTPAFSVNRDVVDVANGAPGEFCGQDALVFSGASGAQRVETFGTDLGDNAFLQVVLSAGCAQATARSDIFLQASDDQGNTWEDLFSQCNRFSSSSCNRYFNFAALPIERELLAGGFQRITVPLGSVPAGRRFRVAIDRDTGARAAGP